MRNIKKSFNKKLINSTKLNESRLKKILNIFKAPSASLNTSKYLLWVLEKAKVKSKILNLGSGTKQLRKDNINLDIEPFKNVNIVGDGSNLPILSNSFDVVICQAVLEHLKEPKDVIKEIYRVLKIGGLIYIEVPFIQGYHADPDDYQRFTLRGLEYLLKEFYKIESGICVGPGSALAWIIREYFSLFFGKNKLRTAFMHLWGWLTFWIKYSDIILNRLPQAHYIASGYFYLGKKQ